MTEAAPIAGADASPPDALDVGRLYVEHRGQVTAVILGIVGASADVDIEDLVHQTFVGVLRGRDRFRGECAPSTWVYRIAVRTALQELRRRRRWRWIRQLGASESADQYPAGSSPTGKLESRAALRALDAALRSLSPKKRAAFVLIDVEGLSLAEAAEALEVPVNTVRSRLGAARRALLSER